MTNTLVFAAGALFMVAVVLLLLLLPFRRRPAGTDFSRQQLNAAIYRDELIELERELAEGALSQADHDQARAELQRRLLDDTADEASAPAAATAPAASRKVPLVLALALPIGATLIYLMIGSPAALNPLPQPQQFTNDDIDRMVEGLAAKLETEPDNLKGWAMLARSYKAMGRIPEALRAFERAGSIIDTDAELLLSHADTLAVSAGRFDDKVNAQIAKALKLDPTNPQGLWMRGTASFEAKQYAKAAADWQSLYSLLEPGSEDARVVEANIAEARQLGGLPAARLSQSAPPPPQVAASKAAPATLANAFVKGKVTLAKNLSAKLAASDMLMVVARPNDGSRMPVAVLRVKAGDLPLDFTLDDSLSMSPDHKLSQFTELVVEARISKSGQAMPQPGDLFSAAQTVKLGADNLKLVVDQVRQ